MHAGMVANASSNTTPEEAILDLSSPKDQADAWPLSQTLAISLAFLSDWYQELTVASHLDFLPVPTDPQPPKADR